MKLNLLLLVILTSLLCSCQSSRLPKAELKYWNNTKTTQRLINYLEDVSNKNSKNFIPLEDRIAVFDNDGTLWGEFPSYVQVNALVDFYKDVTVGKYKKADPVVDKVIMNYPNVKDMNELVQALLTTQAANSNEEYIEYMSKWLDTNKHPKVNKRYIDMAYAPSVELLNLLQEFNFKVFMVTGGGTQFARVLNSKVYHLPSYQVFGSRFGKTFSEEGKLVFKREAKMTFNNDKDGKAINILELIGKVPVFVLGNSDGDFAMAKHTALNSKYKFFIGIIHHDDEKREFSYDRNSHVGKLDKILDQASKYSIDIISMKEDFKQIYISE